MTTVDQNYFLQPGESISAYNTRIAGYNASKPQTPDTVATPAMVQENQNAATAQGVAIPGVNGAPSPISTSATGSAAPALPGGVYAINKNGDGTYTVDTNSRYGRSTINYDPNNQTGNASTFNALGIGSGLMSQIDSYINPKTAPSVAQPAAQPDATTATTAPPAATQNGTQPAAPAVQPAPAKTSSSVMAPSGNLQPGSTGPEVVALQQFLKSKGLLTDAQIATGPGIYGPATTAAVAALQHQLGVQTTSADSGFYGPKTQSAVNGQSATTGTTATGDASGAPGTPQNAPVATGTGTKTAVQSVIDDYTAAYTALGLGDIKTQYQDFVKQQTDLTNQMNDEKAAVDNNPWLSQGVRDKNKAQIDTKYATRLDTLTHQVSLLDAMYKEGQLEVNNIVTKAEAIDAAQVKAAADLAQQKQDAIDALTKANVQEKQFEETLAVQKQNAETSRISALKSGSGGSGTADERKASSLADLQNTIDSAPNGSGITDPNGYLTTAALKKMISAAPSQGLTGEDVISQVQNSLAPNFDKKGNAIPGSVSDKYGLTTSQKKLLGIVP